MTVNQISYLNALENQRANRAHEAEAYRSNVARELETHRSNIVGEQELHRSNVAKEREANRSNVAREMETQRSNLADERLTGRANDATERWRSGQLDLSRDEYQLTREQVLTQIDKMIAETLLTREKQEAQMMENLAYRWLQLRDVSAKTDAIDQYNDGVDEGIAWAWSILDMVGDGVGSLTGLKKLFG